MMNPKSYVRTDEHGVMRVGQTRVMLDGVVIAYWEGDSPESIRKQYPSLTLEDVYGAIAYYLGNRAEVDAYLERQEKHWQELRADQDRNPSPLIKRLVALRAASTQEKK